MCALCCSTFWGLAECSFCTALQIFDKFSISGSSKSSEKLSELLSEADTSLAVQERLKVAFAEGYLASDKKKTDSGITLPQRVLRVIFIVLIVYLFYNLLQMYSALGGSMLSVFVSVILLCMFFFCTKYFSKAFV